MITTPRTHDAHHGPMRRIARKALASRRGTIIVLALGVLAILAISAVSYVAIVRIDRTSVVSAQRQINPQPQVNTVVSEIGSLLVADLFGNKIVNAGTPSNLWPSAFEDGDYTDRPHVDGDWAQNPIANGPSTQMTLPSVAAIARADDAWLAATEPVIDEAAYLDSYWPQITNLRSAWRYYPRSGSRAQQWRRDDGQFVDLMQFFLNPLPTGNANASADLTAGNAFGPTLGTAFITRTGGAAPLDQRAPMRVFGVQMNRVENSLSDINSVSNDQERYWTDTDGDLRPDARWQRLDALGNAYGLTWVVAARIIDASSLINFNTALSFPYRTHIGAPLLNGRTWSDVVGTGETPADVDLFRLLGYAAALSGATSLDDTFTRELITAGAIWPTQVRTDRLANPSAERPALRAMVGASLGFGSTMRKLSEDLLPATDANYNPPYELRLTASPDRYPEQAYPAGFENDTVPWRAMDFPTASQRAVWYRLQTATSDQPAPRSVQPITIRDFADLHAFRATNNTEVTGKLEQYADGTQINGYLPGSGSINAPYGPLRSREGTDGSNADAAASPRRFGSPDQDDTGTAPGLPTLRQLKWDNRHLLTPVSGTGRIGPVPVLNTQTYTQGSITRPAQTSYFDGLRSLTRINIPQLERDTQGPVTRDILQRVFDAFVWALAPLSTDKPLSRELALGNLYNNGADTFVRHYGGATNGPASKLASDLSLSATAGSTYAVLKSLCLTANLIDALGHAGATMQNEAPTALRFFNQNNAALPVQQGIPSLGTRLAQGNIPPAALDPKVLGEPAKGVSVFGIDRQPYLVQASYYAFYEDSDAVGTGAATVDIEPNDAGFKDQLGSIVAFEIRNPWPQPIDLANYKILLRNAAVTSNTPEIEFDLGAAISGVPVVAGGGATVVYFAHGPLTTAPPEMANFWDNSGSADDIVDQFASMLAASGTVPGLAPVRLDPNGVTGRVEIAPGTFTPTAGSSLPPVFAHYLLGGVGQAPVRTIPALLIRKAGGGVPHDTVVDRLSPPTAGSPTDYFPNVLTSNYTHTFVQETDPGPPPVNIDPVGRARVCVASTIFRPTNHTAGSGMPPWIAERRAANLLQNLPLETAGYTAGGGTINRRQVWVTNRAPLGADTEPTATDLVNSGNGALGPGSDPTWQSIGIESKGAFPVAAKFQLFNPAPGSASTTPGTPLPDGGNLPPPMPTITSAADLLLLPTVATVYIHADIDNADPRDASDLTLSYTGDTVTFATTPPSTRGVWVTASEMLGSDWELYRDPIARTVVNPYVGVLDPTQSILSSTDHLAPQSANLPDALTIPLALRVIDAFDGLDHIGDLAPGRVNLNTAPGRVLACLPFLSPLTGIDNADDKDGTAFQPDALPAPTDPNGDPLRYPLLGRWLLPYRSLNLENPLAPGTITPAWRVTNVQLPGLRDRTGQPTELGLVSVGELAVMGQWNPTTGDPTATNNIDLSGFLHVGANTRAERGVPFGRLGSPDRQVIDAYRLVDGPEERAALLRALSNVASTRSDVYIAWFHLRGYSPDEIESIQVNTTGAPPSFAEARAAMNSEKFRPKVDTRWLVVYDRSNVRSPTDRPTVLLQMELPSARP